MNPNPNKLTKVISAVAFILGLSYGILLLVKNACFGYEIKVTEAQFLTILLATGLIGNVLSYILEKYISKVVKEHVSEEFILKIVKEHLSKDIVKIIKEEQGVKDFLLEIVDEEMENKTDELDNSLNTVIVPVKNTLDNIKDNLFYECPENYKFKTGLNYIAFYKEKEIVGYGKLKPPVNYNTPLGGRKVFMIEEFKKIEIPHLKKGAFIQNKMYCNIEKLKSAKNTDEIRS